MIFSGIEFMKEKPFSSIIIHPTVLAKDGRRMSKSLGTGIDPLVLIEKYGADATRFGLIYQMMGGQDIKFDESHLLAGKKFANKLWNITRFVLKQNASSRPQRKSAAMAGGAEKISTPENKEIIKKLEKQLFPYLMTLKIIISGRPCTVFTILFGVISLTDIWNTPRQKTTTKQKKFYRPFY